MSLETKKIEDKTIDRLMDKFTSHLDVDDILLAKCLSNGLITEDNMSKIGDIFRAGRTAEAAMKLMSHVKRSAPGYLKKFCDILNDSKSNFLVSCVEEEYRIQSEEHGEPVAGIFSLPTSTTHDCSPFRTTKPLESDDALVETSPRLSQIFQESLCAVGGHFVIAYEKYEIPTWPFLSPANKVKQVVLQNGHPRVLQAVPKMLHEVGDVLEGASLGESVERYKRLLLNSDNVHSQFNEIISAVLDSGPHSWRKVVTFFSSAAGFGIHLHTNNMSHLATQLPVWTAQVLQDRLQPWIDDQGGWVSTVWLVNFLSV